MKPIASWKFSTQFVNLWIDSFNKKKGEDTNNEYQWHATDVADIIRIINEYYE